MARGGSLAAKRPRVRAWPFVAARPGQRAPSHTEQATPHEGALDLAVQGSDPPRGRGSKPGHECVRHGPRSTTVGKQGISNIQYQISNFELNGVGRSVVNLISGIRYSARRSSSSLLPPRRPGACLRRSRVGGRVSREKKTRAPRTYPRYVDPVRAKIFGRVYRTRSDVYAAV